jgi:hypothetical protein
MSRFEEHLNEFRVQKERTPKISATLKRRASKGEVDAKKIMDWFNRMLKDIDDLESKDAMRIMNVSGEIKKIAQKL